MSGTTSGQCGARCACCRRALEKARDEVEQIHDLSGRDTIQRLEIIFYQIRLARQGR